MHKGATSTETYFPAGTWYNMYNYSTVDVSSGAKTVTVQVRPDPTAALQLLQCRAPTMQTPGCLSGSEAG